MIAHSLSHKLDYSQLSYANAATGFGGCFILCRARNEQSAFLMGNILGIWNFNSSPIPKMTLFLLGLREVPRRKENNFSLWIKVWALSTSKVLFKVRSMMALASKACSQSLHYNQQRSFGLYTDIYVCVCSLQPITWGCMQSLGSGILLAYWNTWLSRVIYCLQFPLKQ